VLDAISVIQSVSGSAGHLLQAAALVLILLITVIGGRVIPFFTRSRLGTPERAEPRALFIATTVLLLLFIALVLNQVALAPWWPATLMLGLLHLARMTFWFRRGVLGESMLWSLFLFYAFLPAGFLLYAYQGWNGHISAEPLHLLTTGTLGGMIASMVGRVSLGHTGRPVGANPFYIVAFTLIAVATIVRSLVPVIQGGALPWHYSLSASLWGMAFLLIVARLLPVWLGPRPDGQ